MTSKAARGRLPAKFVGPDVAQAVLRTRLFELIENGRSPCLWLHGPPGSGKTTLVASHLQARALHPIWYQVDAEDREPSTFFHFLATALKPRLAAKHKLPVADAETRGDWSGFARRFFRAMLAGLADDDALVFDNVHEAGGALDEVLALLVEETAGGQRVYLTSHHPPPEALVDAIAKRRLVEVNADALKFDLSEAVALVGAMTGSRAAAADIERLQTLTEGWAAGLVLLASRPLEEFDLGERRPASRQRLFDYFSRMVIGKMPAETRAVAEACAFLPEFDGALAAAVSGDPRAAAILEALHRNGLFIEMRQVGRVRVFQFHALLAEALRDRVGEAGSAARRAALARAGEALAAAGRIEASIALLMEAGNVSGAAGNVLRIAETVLAEGRLEQLASWITALPDAERAARPWLDYWLGLSLAPTDETGARAVLSDVHLRFERARDELGCLLSAAAMVSCIESGWQDYADFDRWIAALHAHWSPTLVFPSPESELRAVVGLLSVQVGSSLQVEALAGLRVRAAALIRDVKDANAQLSAAVLTVNSYVRAGDFDSALFFENFIHHEVKIAQASPAWQANWHWTVSMMHVTGAQVMKKPALTESGRKHRATAAQIAETHELTIMKIGIAHAEAGRCIWARDVEGLRQALDSVESQIQPGRVRQMIWHLNRRTHLELLSGRPEAAWDAIRRVHELTAQAHYPAMESAVYHNVAASVLIHLERYDEAIARFERTLPYAAARIRLTCEIGILFVRALEAVRGADGADGAGASAEGDGDSAPGSAEIETFFAALRARGMLEFGRLEDRPLARLCAVALARGIESAFVRQLVLHRKFPPPAGAPAAWPWPLRIEALGGFRVTIGDAPLVFEGKSQKKPLEMLQMLVALQDGAGRGPKVRQVMDELWPSLDTKDPQGTFDTTLYRLRKLIGVEGAIVLADGRLALNRELVWCDVAAFEKLARAGTPREEARALRLYAGALLDADSHAWSAVPRERLAALYTGLVERCARRLEDAGDHAGALALYERALAQDNLIEAFYRGVMRCHHARGADADALRAYRRCRELLSIALGVAPTAETEALKAKIAA